MPAKKVRSLLLHSSIEKPNLEQNNADQRSNIIRPFLEVINNRTYRVDNDDAFLPIPLEHPFR